MTEPIRIYRLHELRQLPRPEWLIEGILHRNTIGVLAATKAAFKTFLAIDWGMNIALGRDWNGHKVVQGNVLHLVGEGGSGISARTEAWEIHNALRLPEPSAWACTVTGIDLLNEDCASALVQAAMRVFPEGVELLVIDTLARNQRGDENSTQQMSTLVRNVDAIRDILGCTILFLHHFNRGGTFRGSSALDGAFDTVILMDRHGDVSTVRCDKQKDAPEFDPFRMKSKWIEVPGVQNGSLVLEMDDDVSPHAALIARMVSQLGRSGSGVTRQVVLDYVLGLNPKPFGSSVFNEAWKDAVDKELILPKDGIHLMKGTLWVRNLELLDVAA